MTVHFCHPESCAEQVSVFFQDLRKTKIPKYIRNDMITRLCMKRYRTLVRTHMLLYGLNMQVFLYIGFDNMSVF